ncbi:hypothetical protein COCNU_02G000100 [Cocos nucifera]|uniref:Uncharacterized protein n=1 Tax=Cocos nucifera TaxID=13894 RepID=A0A8K0HY65_COCNU|nr:hypothetical protein COCNU_02G000100 [Cocos nucifera]
MAAKLAFTEEEMAVDECLGYPKAYAKLCSSPSVPKLDIQGPPFAFLPYVLQPQEALRAKDLNQMFPVIDPEAKPSVNPRGFVNLLWKQLDHLGNAGFDPALFRVDPYGNVLYLNADPASPLAWDIDHWFPCSRGGGTVPGNLRLLQWQVYRKKHNKLEFLIPWWDLQLGISVNQFLSIFASRNSDFRNRAFSFLFLDGGSEELNSSQAVESHRFPQHFIEMKRQVGFAPAAIVSSQRSSDASVLKTLDINRSLRSHSPLIAARKLSAEEDDAHNMASQKFRPNISKENNIPDANNNDDNPYLTIAMARDSLRQKEETKRKLVEIDQLDDELNDMKRKNETERLTLQELETVLIKRRRRVEKCRRLAEAQSSYKALLEKMIRDAMHQSVVYKEQLRLNQAASSALMARLETQRAICDASENELRRKFKQRDEIEKQIRPSWEQARKRSRVDHTPFQERHDKAIQFLSTVRIKSPTKKELRVFLEEEQKASEAEPSLGGEGEESGETTTTGGIEKDETCRTLIADRDEEFALGEGHCSKNIESEEKKSSFLIQMEGEDKKPTTMIDEKLEHLAIGERYCRNKEPKKQNLLPQSRKLGVSENEVTQNGKFKQVAIGEDYLRKSDVPKPRSLIPQKSLCEEEDDEDYRNQVGKENVEKWLQMLLGNMQEGPFLDSPDREPDGPENSTNELVDELNSVNPQKEIKFLRLKPSEENGGCDLNSDKQQTTERNCRESRTSEAIMMNDSNVHDGSNAVIGIGTTRRAGSRKSFGAKEIEEKKGALPRSESGRGFRSFPSSPSMILGMRRGAECIGKKPKVIDDGDDRNEDSAATSNRQFLKICTKAIKKAVNK